MMSFPRPRGSGKERVNERHRSFTIGNKYRNPFGAQEILIASLTRSARGRFDAEARSPPTRTTNSQLIHRYVRKAQQH